MYRGPCRAALYEQRTPKTLTRLDALLAELKTVRKTGVAFDREEHTLGICAAGVALRDLLGNDVAISIPVVLSKIVAMVTNITASTSPASDGNADQGKSSSAAMRSQASGWA